MPTSHDVGVLEGVGLFGCKCALVILHLPVAIILVVCILSIEIGLSDQFLHSLQLFGSVGVCFSGSLGSSYGVLERCEVLVCIIGIESSLGISHSICNNSLQDLAIGSLIIGLCGSCHLSEVGHSSHFINLNGVPVGTRFSLAQTDNEGTISYLNALQRAHAVLCC